MQMTLQGNDAGQIGQSLLTVNFELNVGVEFIVSFC